MYLGDCIHTASYSQCSHEDCSHYRGWNTTTLGNWQWNDTTSIYPYTWVSHSCNCQKVPQEIIDMIQRVGTEKVKHFLEKELEKIQKELEEDES